MPSWDPRRSWSFVPAVSQEAVEAIRVYHPLHPMALPEAPPRRFVATFAAAALLTLGAIAALNWVVDPHRLAEGLEEEGFLSSTRPSKRLGLQLAMGDYQGILLGTSRVLLGLSPKHPGFAGRQVANAGLLRSNIVETAQVFDFATDNQDLDLLVLGLDLVAFSDTWGKGSSEIPANFPGRSVELEYALAWISADMSVDTVERLRRQILRAVRPEDAEAVDAENQARIAQALLHLGGPKRQRKWEKTLRTYLGDYYGCLQYDPRRIDALMRILRTARDRGIEAHLFFSPLHAMQLEGLAVLGRLEEFHRWKRDVAEAVERVRTERPGEAPPRITLWDFTGSPARTTDGLPTPWYSDPSHYSRVFGNVLLEQILQDGEGSSDEEVGIRLGPQGPPEGWDDQWARLLEVREHHRRTRPGQVQLVRKLARETRAMRRDCARRHPAFRKTR